MNILSVIPMDEEQRARLESTIGADSVYTYTAPKAVTEAQVKAADIILGNVPAGMIGASEKLKLLQLNSAGTDAYIVPGVLSGNTVLCNATGAYGRSVAEHSFATLMMLIKNLHLYRDDQNECVWRDEGPVTSISDMTVLIIGAGDIGLYFARMCKALGAKTIGVKRRPSGELEGLDEVVLSDRLLEVVPKADAVVTFLPGTPATKGMFNADFFAAMKDTAVFINGGRGSSVVTDDLYKALQNGVIRAAGLDVFEQEPLPSENPIWKLRNVMITPHVAGGFHLDSTLRTIVDIAIRNADAVAHGRTPENIVDMKTGYKA